MSPGDRLIEGIKHLSYEDCKKVRNHVTKPRQIERVDVRNLASLCLLGRPISAITTILMMGGVPALSVVRATSLSQNLSPGKTAISAMNV